MTHDAFHTPNLSHEITEMIITTGQMCTVNYSDRPGMCDLNYPKLEKYDILQKKKKKKKNDWRVGIRHMKR